MCLLALPFVSRRFSLSLSCVGLVSTQRTIFTPALKHVSGVSKDGV